MASLFVFGVANTNAARSVEIDDPRAAGYGAEVLVKDDGNQAGTNNITIAPVAGFIDGMSSAVIDSNGGALRLRSDGVEWRKIATNGGGGGSTFPPVTGNILLAAGGNGGILLDTTGGGSIGPDEIDMFADAAILIQGDLAGGGGVVTVQNGTSGSTLQLREAGAGGLASLSANSREFLINDAGLISMHHGGGTRVEIGATDTITIAGAGAGGIVASATHDFTIISGGATGITLESDASLGNGDVTVNADGKLSINANKISEFGGTGSVQSAPIANATNATDVITQLNALLAYLRLRGTLAT